MPINLGIIIKFMATKCNASPSNGVAKGSLFWVLKFRFPKLESYKKYMYILYILFVFTKTYIRKEEAIFSPSKQ